MDGLAVWSPSKRVVRGEVVRWERREVCLLAPEIRRLGCCCVKLNLNLGALAEHEIGGVTKRVNDERGINGALFKASRHMREIHSSSSTR